METTEGQIIATQDADLQINDKDEDGFVDVNVKNSDDSKAVVSDADDHHLLQLGNLPHEQEQFINEPHSAEQPLIGENFLPESHQQNMDTNLELSPNESDEHENQFEMRPLLLSEDEQNKLFPPAPDMQEEDITVKQHIRSRKKPDSSSISRTEYEDETDDMYAKRSCLRKNLCGENNVIYHPVETSNQPKGGPAAAMGCGRIRRFCHATSQHYLVRTTVSVMNLLARILLWTSFLAMVVAVVWYSRELKMNGTDPHLIAWFSAGAFVLLGFPISMCGIFMHLTNYYQPNVQCYVVRILWMVPIYSIESWLW